MTLVASRGLITVTFAFCVVVALLVFAVVHSRSSDKEIFIGQASVVDGDTLKIHDTRIRIWGIDAPESAQLCRGDDSALYHCGAKAANELDAFIAARPVTCSQVDTDRYGRPVAVCSIGDEDLANWLVRNGLALDWPKYSQGEYSKAQFEAQSNERGIWTGSYIVPWAYRACIRNGGRPGNCSDDASR